MRPPNGWSLRTARQRGNEHGSDTPPAAAPAWVELVCLVRVLVLDPSAYARAVELLRRLLPLLLAALAIILAWQLPAGELIELLLGLLGA